jgi:hypothetical protein
MAALTRSGAMKASEIVIFTFRTLHISRSAMLAGVAVESATSSSNRLGRTRLHDRAPFDGLSRNPKNLGPFQRVPVMSNAIFDRLT